MKIYSAIFTNFLDYFIQPKEKRFQLVVVWKMDGLTVLHKVDYVIVIWVRISLKLTKNEEGIEGWKKKFDWVLSVVFKRQEWWWSRSQLFLKVPYHSKLIIKLMEFGGGRNLYHSLETWVRSSFMWKWWKHRKRSWVQKWRKKETKILWGTFWNGV